MILLHPGDARTRWNWFSLFLYGTILPLGQPGATHRIDCLADLLFRSFSKEHTFGDLNPSIPGDLHRVKFNNILGTQPYSILCSTCKDPGIGGFISPTKFSSLFQRQSPPIMKGGADQVCSLSSVLLLAVPEAFCTIQKLLRSSPYGENCACGMGEGSEE